jgi:hypothetical protein
MRPKTNMPYKECENCGHDIGHRRLVAVPDATLCVRCQAREDVPPIRAHQLGEALACGSEFTPGEAQRMTQRGGG